MGRTERALNANILTFFRQNGGSHFRVILLAKLLQSLNIFDIRHPFVTKWIT